jgi:hypothetical protein
MFYNPRSYSPTVEEEKQNKANVSEKKEKIFDIERVVIKLVPVKKNAWNNPFMAQRVPVTVGIVFLREDFFYDHNLFLSLPLIL